jgi:hypothetical protein
MVENGDLPIMVGAMSGPGGIVGILNALPTGSGKIGLSSERTTLAAFVKIPMSEPCPQGNDHSFLTSRSLTIPGGLSGGRLCSKVRQIHATTRLAALAARLGAPKTIVGEPVQQIARADSGPYFAARRARR